MKIWDLKDVLLILVCSGLSACASSTGPIRWEQTLCLNASRADEKPNVVKIKDITQEADYPISYDGIAIVRIPSKRAIADSDDPSEIRDLNETWIILLTKEETSRRFRLEEFKALNKDRDGCYLIPS